MLVVFEWIRRIREQRAKNRAILKQLAEQAQRQVCGLCLARRAAASAAAPGGGKSVEELVDRTSKQEGACLD
jgi:hypothetical protein